MQTVVLVVHLLLAIALVATVLVQRSDGGALGLTGGGGFGGMMSGRGAANVLTRTTAVLAAAFFLTSILLAILARQGTEPTSILDSAVTAEDEAPALPELPSVPLSD